MSRRHQEELLIALGELLHLMFVTRIGKGRSGERAEWLTTHVSVQVSCDTKMGERGADRSPRGKRGRQVMRQDNSPGRSHQLKFSPPAVAAAMAAFVFSRNTPIVFVYISSSLCCFWKSDRPQRERERERDAHVRVEVTKISSLRRGRGKKNVFWSNYDKVYYALLGLCFFSCAPSILLSPAIV